MLESRLGATKHEISLWAWLGRQFGGIEALASRRHSRCSKAENCNDFSRDRCESFLPQRLYPPCADQVSDGDRPWSWLTDAYFLKEEIEGFSPSPDNRFISWGELLDRWQSLGLTKDDILAKVRGRIYNDELLDVAPIFGGSTIGGETGAPKKWAMFQREHIEAIETHDLMVGDSSSGGGAAIGDAGSTAKNEKFGKIVVAAKDYIDKWRENGKEPTVSDAASYVQTLDIAKGYKASYIKRAALDPAKLGRPVGYKSKNPPVHKDKKLSLP